MTGLVRADTELMLAAAEEMQRVSQLMVEQFANVQRAMEELQTSWWHGNHRQAIEEGWARLAVHFEPSTTTLQELAVRLKRTATALDAAALLFAEPVAGAGTGSAPAYGKWLLEMLSPSVWLRLGLSGNDPVAMLDLLCSTPAGRALLKAMQVAHEQGEAGLDTRLPENGPPPRIFIINGIDSDAIAGAPDASALFLERKLEERGYNPQDVEATAAVYNTNFDTELEGTHFGGWLQPIDTRTAQAASVLNTVTDIGNKFVGAAQVTGEYILGENGFYTQQTIDEVKASLQANPLLEGQGVLLISHSGGGAITPNVAQALQRSNVPVAGVVTMGSPVSNRDQASQVAHQVVELRDQHDYIGLPLLRSAEGSATTLAFLAGALPMGAVIAGEVFNRNAAANVARVTTSSGESSVVNAHTSYWNSEEAVKTLSKYFPSVGRALQRQAEPKANP